MTRFMEALFNRLRFNQKLFLSYLAVIIIPILVLGIYAYRQSEKMLRIQAAESIERNVEAISQSINSDLEQYNHTIRSIVNNRTFQRIVRKDYLDLVNLSRDLKEYLSPYLSMMMMMNSDISRITFYTQSDVPEYGDSVLSYGRVKNEPWYPDAIEKKGNRWHLDASGNLSVTELFPRFFSDPYKNIFYMQFRSGSLFRNISDLAKGYGITIADENDKMLYVNPIAEASQVGNLKGVSPEPNTIIEISGTKLYVVTKTIPQTNWTVRCFVPVDQVTPKAGTILGATLIVIGSCMIILLIMISVFSKTMIRRIYKLNSLMRRVENGELSLQVRSGSKDEIGELTNRFGNMLVRLNALIEEVYANKLIQKEAELRALQSQINPHFLYNTLSFINWEAIKSEQFKISHVVTALSRFYRTSLNRGDNIISVRDEMENIKSYLDIMLMMSDYAFDVVFDINEEVYGYRMLNLILQPLVENAVKHGVDSMQGRRGVIAVTARVLSRTIEFTVEDNGPGMTEEEIGRLVNMQSSGYGLRNVNDRIKLFFGGEYGVGIESAFGKGTIMKVTIPQFMKE
ncbi:cache domain-containing sensor histidine kinase [Paenibacillus sp. DMB20]|uniref:cache domain-containing sensor histidine kinase n=1 Tax=Paenibacillus sp. DMB20 TaxID=1642570 RepID=UPI000699726D|nr:histidine kinase [Paenibacillus sp. DMB20]